MALQTLAATKPFPIPAAYFGMVLGVVGMGTAWRMAAHIWGLPGFIGETLMALAVGIWVSLAVVFIIKWIWYRPAALAEVEDSIQCCFISLFPGKPCSWAQRWLPMPAILPLGW